MTAQASSLAAIFVRELNTLRMEIEAYPSDAELWRVVPGISNSGGTLALHLAGNLQHFIGAILGGSGYLRDRDAEFASRDVSRAELVRQVDEASAEVQRTLEQLDPAALERTYPQPVANVRVTTADFLTHLASHLAYHLGQVNYHRRILTGGAPLSGALSPTRLASATAVQSG
ncbi:MAG TPA: DinB family protein [Gemmatimonadales bacterium]|jgi:uncharacterized damage-inducible protein DinB|nr:DinB family protein [Gemmatimonadales bacterium]